MLFKKPEKTSAQAMIFSFSIPFQSGNPKMFPNRADEGF